MSEIKCFAWQENDGTIDLDSISETIEGVRIKCLQQQMGWRFHDGACSRHEAWKIRQKYGHVVKVIVSFKAEQ